MLHFEHRLSGGPGLSGITDAASCVMNEIIKLRWEDVLMITYKTIYHKVASFQYSQDKA